MEFSQQTDEIAKDILELAGICIEFSREERTPHYPDGRRETNVEHSFMLGMIATGLADEYFPELDSGWVCKFSNIHDMVELITGDVSTFHAHEQEIAEKERREQEALHKLRERFSNWPVWIEIIEKYEEQEIPEARFVRIIDKIMPALANIYNQGYTWRTEYNVTHVRDLDEGKARRAKRLADYEEDQRKALTIMNACLELMREMLFDNDGYLKEVNPQLP